MYLAVLFSYLALCISLRKRKRRGGMSWNRDICWSFGVDASTASFVTEVVLEL